MKQGEQANQRRRERDLLRLVLQYPSLLRHGEVEEAIGCFAFTHTGYNRLRQLVLDALAENPELHRDLLLVKAQEQGLSKELNALLKGDVAAKLEESNEQRALQLWRLLSTEHTLTGLQAECRELEAELAEEVSEEAYARLVALKKQAGELQREAANLQNELEG